MQPSEFMRHSRVIVTLPSATAEDCLLACEVMMQEQVACFAVQPDSYAELAGLIEVVSGRAEIGVVGLRRVEEVGDVVSAGAAFALLDVADPALVRACLDAGLPCFPPALTPTEIAAVAALGATGVQVVPVDAMGEGYPSHVQRTQPGATIVAAAAGEIDHDTFAAWLRCDALAVVLDQSVVGNAIYAGGDLNGLRRRCQGYAAVMPTLREWTGPSVQ